MNVPENLPFGWQAAKFEEVCEIISGKNQKFVACETGPFPIYGSGGLIGFANDFLCEAGTTIVGRKGTINTPIFVQERFWNVDTAFGLCPNKAYDSKLFYFYCKGFNFKSLDKSTTIPSLAKTDLLQIQIPLPPLAEQHRIVAKIEELFLSLDQGIEALKAAQQQLKVYRQAVLKYAFEGRLTHPGLQEGELPEGWESTTTGKILDVINNGYTPKKQYLTADAGDIPFIKVYNLKFDGTLNHLKNPTFIPRAIHNNELKRSICYPNDVLINIVGPPLGKVSIVTDHFPEWNINQAIVVFRPNQNIIPKYLSFFLQSPKTIQWLENTSKATAGQWNVKVSTCREIPIWLPRSENEQILIVQEIESRLSVCDQIEASITASLEQAEALRQSILKKAFEGKLVPQDPADEPAHVLLERIKAERGGVNAAGRKRAKV